MDSAASCVQFIEYKSSVWSGNAVIALLPTENGSLRTKLECENSYIAEAMTYVEYSIVLFMEDHSAAMVKLLDVKENIQCGLQAIGEDMDQRTTELSNESFVLGSLPR